MVAIPKVRRFGKGDRVYVKAQQVWLILVSAIMQSRKGVRGVTMTYGDLAEAMGMPRRAGITLVRPLWIVGDYCVRNSLPTINSIVVNDEKNVPGVHVVTRKGKTFKQEQTGALKQDWYALRVPSTGTFRKVWESLQTS